MGAGALGWALGERAGGRRWACVGARAGAAGSWARGRKAQQACGAGGRTAGGARVGEARGSLGELQQPRGARQQALGGGRQAQAGARGVAGWAASAHLGVLNWARLGFCAP